MSAVRQWLETIDLAQYGDAFEANDIDMDVLRQVDDQMLKDFGVASGGYRLRIRNPIRLRGLAIETKINAQAEYIVSLAARGLCLKVSLPAGSHRRSPA